MLIGMLLEDVASYQEKGGLHGETIKGTETNK